MKAIVSILLLLLAVLACVTPAEAQVGRDLLTRERRPRRERRGREDRPRRERRGREDRPRRERRPRGDDGDRERDPRGDDGAMPPPMPTPTVTPTPTPTATPANTTTPPTTSSTTPPPNTTTTTTPAAPMPADCPSILDLVAASEDLSTLGMAVQAAELGPLFSNKTAELTVLAPTNAAFDAVPAEALQALVEDKDALVAILGLHVIEGVVKAADLEGLTEAGAVTGTLGVSTDMGVSFTGPDGGSTANVVEADIMSCAGVVHKIDAVIVPGTPATEVPPGTTGTR